MSKILIVDDEKSIRVTLREFLTHDGHEVVVASDAPEAETAIQQNGFDVVVTDVILPFASGLELLRVVRERCPRAKIVLITGEPTAEGAELARKEGVAAYLSKPVSGAEMRRIINDLLGVKIGNPAN